MRAAANVYSIGDPSPEEQLYVELINRARANPNAEAQRLATSTDPLVLTDYRATGVDLNLMIEQFSTLSEGQPLAINPRLAAAALGHSLDMFTNSFQEHIGSDGGDTKSRLLAVGYTGAAGENVYSYAKSVFHGHAAFEVDWGGPETATNGFMQYPPGHRLAIHNPTYREIGVGVVIGSHQVPGRQPVGPQLVTQNFGVQQNATPFITGVAYYDLNGNGFYDMGEGIGGVRVTVSPATHEGLTSRSGGYAIPVAGNGTYTVTFSGAGFADSGHTVTVVGSRNLKLDFTPEYHPPAISGPGIAAVDRLNAYSIAPVAGASTYQWRSFKRVPAAPEGAENGFARVLVTQTGAYDVIVGIAPYVKSGAFAFHLVTPIGSARSQYITLSPTYLVNNSSVLSFQSIVGFGTPDQHARVQVSTDDGAHWETIWNQDSDIDNPEQSWSGRSVSLAPFAGKPVRIRFGYEFFIGSYVSSTDLNVGWLIDDIQFTSVDEIVDETVAETAAPGFTFVPGDVADYSLQARARTGHEFLDWGPLVTVRARESSGEPELRLSVSRIGSEWVIEANVTAGAAPASLVLESKGALTAEWLPDTSTFQPVSSSRYRAAVQPSGGAGARFYRVRVE